MAAARGAVGVTVNVGAAFAQCSSKCKCTSLAQSTKNSKALPVFGMPSMTRQNKTSNTGNNKRSRKQQNAPKLTTVFEYACGANSMLGRVHAELKVPHVRLSKDGLNVQALALQSSYMPSCAILQRNICGFHCHVLQGALGIESA